MVVYEVNHLDIHADIYDRYLQWLSAHARKMLALPGFVRVELFECQDPTIRPQSRGLCAHYYLRAPGDLDRYLAEEAPRMRQEGLQLFPDQSRIVRRVLCALPASIQP